LPPKSSTRLRRTRATLQRPARAPRNLRQHLIAYLRHGEDRDATPEQRDADADQEATVRARAAEPAGIQVDVHEGEGDQEERRLHDRLGQVVDSARGQRLAARHALPLQEAQVHPDASRRARDRQVDELDRRLK
jgi:hypothetical protein